MRIPEKMNPENNVEEKINPDEPRNFSVSMNIFILCNQILGELHPLTHIFILCSPCVFFFPFGDGTRQISHTNMKKQYEQGERERDEEREPEPEGKW